MHAVGLGVVAVAAMLFVGFLLLKTIQDWAKKEGIGGNIAQLELNGGGGGGGSRSGSGSSEESESESDTSSGSGGGGGGGREQAAAGGQETVAEGREGEYVIYIQPPYYIPYPPYNRPYPYVPRWIDNFC
ncbi:hypothetical protein M5689_002050 [Euphorbia peplus]|nr:hypothetical protein M5689_002050 [Euphorbia peplus]